MLYNDFKEARDRLIDGLEAKELSKLEFIEKNYVQFVEDVPPPKVIIKSVEEGIMAYHYYNTKAKKFLLIGNDNYYRDPSEAKKYHDAAFDLYLKKDQITQHIIELLDYKEMEAYFVLLHSEELNESLYEIVLLNYYRVIFHSKDKRLLNRLKKHDVFADEAKISMIDDYVNTKYCE